MRSGTAIRVEAPSDGQHRLVVAIDGQETVILMPPIQAGAVASLLQKQLVFQDSPTTPPVDLPIFHVSGIRSGHGQEGPGVLLSTDQMGSLALVIPLSLIPIMREVLDRLEVLQAQRDMPN